MTNFSENYVKYTAKDLEGYMRQARIERARYMAKIFSKAFSGLKIWNDKRKARNALNALDDRMLRDIGISRCEINHIVENNITGNGKVFSFSKKSNELSSVNELKMAA